MGGHHHHGGHGGGRRRGGFYNPAFVPVYDDWYSNAPTVPTSSLYRGYVITTSDSGYDVSKAGDPTVLKTFSSYHDARAFIDLSTGVQGIGGFAGAAAPKLMTWGAVAAGIYIAFFREPPKRRP